MSFGKVSGFFQNEFIALKVRGFKPFFVTNKKAMAYYEGAIAIAPEWGLPYINYCIELYYDGERQKAIEYGEKALTIIPDYPPLYNLLAWVYGDGNELGERSKWEREGIEPNDDFIFWLDDMRTINP